jgi:hypothetical protein
MNRRFVTHTGVAADVGRAGIKKNIAMSPTTTRLAKISIFDLRDISDDG